MSAVKRYKSAFRFRCENGHGNFWEKRIVSDSRENAEKASFQIAKSAQCRYCKAGISGPLQLMGTEEISLYPEYSVIGYVCKCGERVSVVKNETGDCMAPLLLDSITVSCSKGHERKVLNREIPGMEWWEEKTS